ncbi:anti-anti-sigma factor [Nonomuraea solani]|uniref:Anti-anti-sigma factor n=1 Tax=Nonomuraea solani TaxID=1144553 RepID=A0A1H6F397_9ACTN|nr:STAS domain-containing protein [Nonomuraea solani]SEH03525.1 anti-anti-sigma factor [Nonomuraea solani]
MNTTPAPAPVIAAAVEPPEIAPSPITAADRLLRITPLADRAGLRIEGELDCSTLPTLRRALASMTGGAAAGRYCVDLSGLAFIDTGCLRVLVSAAAAVHEGGGDQVLTLRSAIPQVRRLLELTGWHRTPGLHLQASARPG